MVDKMFVCFPHSYRGRGSWLVEEEEQEKQEKEAGVVDNICVDPFCSWSGLVWGGPSHPSLGSSIWGGSYREGDFLEPQIVLKT